MKIAEMFTMIVMSLTLAAGAAVAGQDSNAAPTSGMASAMQGADSAVPSQAAGAAAAAAEVKAAKGVESREPVDEGTSFAAGEKVYIWSRITGAADTTIKHVWKKDGNEIWTASLPVKSVRWTTYSRRSVSAGQYQVEVQGQDGSVLGSVSFSVQ